MAKKKAKKPSLSDSIAKLRVKKVQPSGKPAKLLMVAFRAPYDKPSITIQLSNEVDMKASWESDTILNINLSPVVVTNKMHLYPLQTSAFDVSVQHIRPYWDPAKKLFRLKVTLDEKTPFLKRKTPEGIVLEFKR